jgi:hypothetical protein
MNLQQFIGKTVEEARRIATNAGLEVKVQLIGIQSLNNEFRQGRINFKVEDGVVVSASVG